jgi:glycosyltransferase involved in cell wall biosynthesis
MGPIITVAIPTLDAGEEFVGTLEAVARQEAAAEIELLVCDSGSSDSTVALARAHGARVIEIPRSSFSHGGTRNLLMSRARGAHVAFLTQDAVPVGPGWLAALLGGFGAGQDVGLVFGPYVPRPDAGLSVRRELETWFSSLAPDGGPRIDRLGTDQRDMPARGFWGPLGYFTDANGCVSRAAWERAPFRAVAYAEDHLLAQDMLRAGFAKVFLPAAAVVHSHEYSASQWLRRSFDETRAIAEVYGGAPASGWRDAVRNLRGNVGADVRLARATGGSRGAVVGLRDSLVHHGARTAGAMLGARANALPDALTGRISLERRR